MLDEPTAGVDAESQRRFRDSLVHLIDDHGSGVLLVSHELSAVAHDVDRVIVLKEHVLFDGPPAELAERGVSPRRPRGGPPAVARGPPVMLAMILAGQPPLALPLVASVAIGAFAPLIGTFLVQKRLSLIGDGIGHVAFAGAGRACS